VIVFLDRDGTINVKAPEGVYIERPDELELLPGAAEAIARLNRAGHPVAIVTNQRGIALGRMTEQDLAAVHAHLDALLAEHGARIDHYEHCPHDRGECECRKPGVLMLERAAAALGEDPEDGVMIGDAESDIEAGRRVGARTFRVGHDVADLAAAVDALLAGG
jgi:D-glycero-D-manno-heptose 1,7-bisphosphate phosphatase